MKIKYLHLLILMSVIFVSGCVAQETHEETENHATVENVAECFEHHTDDSYEEALEHCQEDICGTDEHCAEEVEEFSHK